MQPRDKRKRVAVGCAALAAMGAVALLLAPIMPVPEASASEQQPGRPNIILIQADDQTLRQLSDETMPRTERRLVDHGTRFTSYIATTAQCCPSRSTLLTGQYAHNHGVTSNNVGYAGLLRKDNVLPVWLRAAGYRTMHVGSKYVNGYPSYVDPPSRVAPGWDEWYTSYTPIHYYDYRLSINGDEAFRGNAPDDYIGRVLAHEATQLVDTYAPLPRPFYLQLDEMAPHVSDQDDPYGPCSRAAIPDPRDEGEFDSAALPEPPSFDEQDMADKPPFIASAPRLSESDEQRLTAKWRCALASMTDVDRAVAQLVTAVKRAGELSRTVFIYVSDNGLFYGEHRIRSGKVLPYEEAIHLPLLLRVPRPYRDGAPRVREVGKLVGNIDIAPTILDLAGAKPCRLHHGCRTMDGRSLMPLLTGSRGWPSDRGLLTEYREPGLPRYSTCEFAGIRTRELIYVEHYRVTDPSTGGCVDANPPQVERYDLKADPFELHNRCYGGSPTSCPHGNQQAELEARLAKLRKCIGITGRDEPVPGHPYCE